MRVLVTTAVPAERDAVAAAFTGGVHAGGAAPTDGTAAGGAATGTASTGGASTRPASTDEASAGTASPGTVSTGGVSTGGVAEHTVPGAVLHRPVRPADRPSAAVWDLLAGGVGPASAAASTAAALTAAALAGDPYGLVVSAGIGGGFVPGAPVAALVLADAITAADLGAETPDGFAPVTELGFGTVTHRPPESLVREIAAVTGARTGTVLTVSTVTGTAERAAELRRRHPRALAEAMEGFGVAEAAAAHGVPVLEIRAVSNPVGPRDRAAWRIGDALAALTGAFGKLAPVLEGWNPHDRIH